MFDQMIDQAMNFQITLAAYDGASRVSEYTYGLWQTISLMLTTPPPR